MMEIPYLVPYLTVYPVLIGLVALAIGATRRERMLRRKKIVQLKDAAQAITAATLPPGGVLVKNEPLARRTGLVLKGTRMLVSFGTVGANRLLDTLIRLERAGLADTVGSIFVYECESSSRQKFENALPVVYRDRVVYGFARDFPSGFDNNPPSVVKSKIGRWGVELKDAVEAVVKLHAERNGDASARPSSGERASAAPGEVLVFGSLGGHAYPGVYLVRELRAHLREAQFLGIINLPRKTAQRGSFKLLKQEFEDAGISAWIIGDQMEPDWVTQDSMVSAILAGTAAAVLGSDGAPAINNVIANAAGIGTTGGIVRFTYCYADVVAHPFFPDPAAPPKYYVLQEQVESELRKLVAAVEEGEGAVSLDVPVKWEGVNIYDIALIQLDPGPTRAIRDEIERSRDLEDAQLGYGRRLHPLVDYETIYTSFAAPIDPQHPRCRLLVIRLQAVDAPIETIIAPPLLRASALTATRLPDVTPVPASLSTGSTNGAATADDLDEF